MGSAQGEIVGLRVKLGRRQPMRQVEPMVFVAGSGIEGDMHFSDKRHLEDYQVLLMQEENLDALALDHGVVSENVTTTGIDLQSLERDTRLGLGDEVVLRDIEGVRPLRAHGRYPLGTSEGTIGTQGHVGRGRRGWNGIARGLGPRT